VLGREFPLGLIKRMTGKSEDELEPVLSVLRLAEFIYEQPAFPDIEYTFKHALTQEVAYNSVLVERRRLLHERAAQSIEELFADRLEDHLTELAHHFDRSGNVPKAVEYLGRTGARTAQQGAHTDAIGCFSRALELLRQLPDGAARDRQELDLQMALGWSSFVAGGERAPKLEYALVRARELGEQLGENAKLMETLLALAHYNRRDFRLARELAERVLAMAEQATAPAMLVGAHTVLGSVRFATGQFPAAREHLERAVELPRTGPSRNYSAFFAQLAWVVLVEVLDILGYPFMASTRIHGLLGAARQSSDPDSITNALLGHGLHHVLLRDTDMVAERADELLSIATEHEMAFRMIAATFFRGWAMAAAGRGEEGIAEMRRSISDPVANEVFSTALLVVALAETCGKNGRMEEGLDLVTKGLTTAQQTGLSIAESELHRIKGNLLMIKSLGNVAEAEGWLRTAIDIARQQGARLFELRATVSLARLLKQRGETYQARQMLAESYGWFTEGFDTPDLREAKALLEELKA
jgi:tetratricopeptide (TPR) repeat protein